MAYQAKIANVLTFHNLLMVPGKGESGSNSNVVMLMQPPKSENASQLTLIVSKGCPTTTVHMPPKPPGNTRDQHDQEDLLITNH